MFFSPDIKKYNKIIRKKQMNCTNAVKNRVLWGEKKKKMHVSVRRDNEGKGEWEMGWGLK